MGFLDIRNVTKSYGAVKVLHETDIAVEEGEFLVLVGPSGCGKSTLLNMIAGLEEISLGRDRDQGARHERRAPGRAQHRDGVPVLRALPQHERRAEHGLRARDARRAEARARQGGGRGRRAPADHPPARPQARPALGRPAPARRDGPGAGARAGRVPVRRAAVEPRRQAARRHAHRDQEAAPEARHHHRLRHPRPDRGADAVDPDRGDVRRLRPAARHAEGDLRQPGQPVRRELHGLALDEPVPGAGGQRRTARRSPRCRLADGDDGAAALRRRARPSGLGRARRRARHPARGDHRPRRRRPQLAAPST